MHPILKAIAASAVAIAGAATAQTPAPPPYNPQPVLSADLGLGGTGAFDGVVDTDKGELCYMLYAAGVQNPTGAYIRDGKTNAAVVTLATPTGGSSGACGMIGPDLAKKLVRNAGDYYVDIASAAYPSAVRAWLKATIPDKVVA